jgi:hypothetical protein
VGGAATGCLKKGAAVVISFGLGRERTGEGGVPAARCHVGEGKGGPVWHDSGGGQANRGQQAGWSGVAHAHGPAREERGTSPGRKKSSGPSLK